jgi:hypothetical protein
MAGNRALNCLFHIQSFRVVLGLPREALPPRAASLLRSALVRPAQRARPALVASAVRSAFDTPSHLGLAASFASATACGFLRFFVVMTEH